MAVEAVIFSVYDSVTGAPKTGAAGGMSFFTYKDDLGVNLAQPSITEVGGGQYKFVPTFTLGRAICFIIQTGQNPIYVAGSIRPEDLAQWSFAPSPGVVVFAVYDNATGVPKTGVSPTFTVYEDQNGTALAQPTISQVGGGLYKFTPSFSSTNEVAFTVSTGNSPIYVSGSLRVEDLSQTGFIAVSAIAATGQLTISFAAGYTLDALSPFVSNPANWSISGLPAVTVTAVNLISNTIVLTTTTQSNGSPYTVNIPSGITANTGTFALLGPFSLAFTGLAGDPTLVGAQSIDEFTVDVFFSFPPQASRALDVTQYSIAPALTVNSVQQMGPSWYRLTTGPQTIGQTYNLTWPLH